MVMNKIIGTSVGADLSRPPPIYRPSMHVGTSVGADLSALAA